MALALTMCCGVKIPLLLQYLINANIAIFIGEDLLALVDIESRPFRVRNSINKEACSAVVSSSFKEDASSDTKRYSFFRPILNTIFQWFSIPLLQVFIIAIQSGDISIKPRKFSFNQMIIFSVKGLQEATNYERVMIISFLHGNIYQ